MKRKLFTFLLAIVASSGALFAEKVKIGDLYYNLDATYEKAEVTYQSYLSASNYSDLTIVDIPSSVEYEGKFYNVTTIGLNAFRYCSSLTSISLPYNVILIEGGAFGACSSLALITIPNSVTSIASEAFTGSAISEIHFKGSMEDWCAKSWNPFKVSKNYTLYIGDVKVENIIIPNNVTSVGRNAFQGCSSLTSVTIPNGVTSIGNSAFKGCSSLISATIPNNVTIIDEDAFNGCSSLASMTIPDNVQKIGAGAFYSCSSLTSVTIPNSVTSIGWSAFGSCSGLTSVTISNSITSLVNDVFRRCSSLTSVTIPSSVEDLGWDVFTDCEALKDIYLEAFVVPAIKSTTFKNIHKDVIVHVPFGYAGAYRDAEFWSDMNIKVDINQDITSASTGCIISLSATGEILSCGIEGGETFAGNVLEFTGLEPETEYNKTIALTSNTGETETINVSFTTTALQLTTQQPSIVSSSMAILLAETNMADAEVNCGFEWRRDNQPEGMASTKVYAPVANGVMAGRLKGLKDDVYYKYRAFYESSAGNKYYGDWQYIFTGDQTVEFDPVMYTYPAQAVTETTAILRGYALAGSDDFTEQGFEYWVEKRVTPESAAGAPYRAYRSAIGEHMTVQASGISMKVTLTDLDEGSVYKYRSYAVVDGQTVYGSEETFTTRGEYLYTVTFVDYDGTILGTDKVHYGDAATAPEDPTREGYEFAGWDLDFSNVTDDLTITATYSIATSFSVSTATSSKAQKLLRNGQLFILRDGKIYSVQGLEVR